MRCAAVSVVPTLTGTQLHVCFRLLMIVLLLLYNQYKFGGKGIGRMELEE